MSCMILKSNKDNLPPLVGCRSQNIRKEKPSCDETTDVPIPRHPSRGGGGNRGSMKEKPIRVRYDYATEKWFKKHPMHETTVMQCEACGLYYKPSLGHRCKKKGTKAGDMNDGIG